MQPDKSRRSRQRSRRKPLKDSNTSHGAIDNSAAAVAVNETVLISHGVKFIASNNQLSIDCQDVLDTDVVHLMTAGEGDMDIVSNGNNRVCLVSKNGNLEADEELTFRIITTCEEEDNEEDKSLEELGENEEGSPDSCSTEKRPVAYVGRTQPEDEGLLNTANSKPKRKSSFFSRRNKKAAEDDDDETASITSSSSLPRKTSFLRRSFRKLFNPESFGNVGGLLGRSMSFRDISGGGRKLRKESWAASLQSLHEVDHVSCDFSFINYDLQNTYVNNSNSCSRPALQRTTSLFAKNEAMKNAAKTRAEIRERNAVSLVLPSSSDEDDTPVVQGSILGRSVSLCKHQDEATEKPVCRINSSRSIVSCNDKELLLKNKQLEDTKRPSDAASVRSRSLNHLDHLGQEMLRRNNSATGADSSGTGLKDSRSEPDCTRPPERLAVPEALPQPPERAVQGRRRVLSRSQVSSSEFFNVNLEVGDESARDEFLPATKGTSLGDALRKICDKKVDLTNCDIYLDNVRASPTILAEDTFALGGKQIRITAVRKASSGNQLKKTSSGSYKGKSGSFFSSSTEETSLHQDHDLFKKQPNKRWSYSIFNTNKDEKTKLDQLTDFLNKYSASLRNEEQPEAIKALYSIEDDWQHVVDSTGMSERQKQQQTAIWELFTTEAQYIKTLRVVTDLSLTCLRSLQANNIFVEIDSEKLFSNITEVLEANLAFWQGCLYPCLQRARLLHLPLQPLDLEEGFLALRDTFRAYFRYCAEQARCQRYCKEINAANELFKAYLAWCETQKDCNRLRLMENLVKPMQRLTKYGLLLKAIYKNTDDETSKESLRNMIKSVDDFVNNVNSSLQQRQDNERLRGIIARIESYDIVDSKDDDLEKLLKNFNSLDLNAPMVGCPPERRRHLLLEGDLKLKDSAASKMEVHCFLLTDMLLVCKPTVKKGVHSVRVVRQPYLVDRLHVTELARETPSLALVYLNEFGMAVAAFILQNSDSAKLKCWADLIRKAQVLYQQAKLPRHYAEDSLEGEFSLDLSMEDVHSLPGLLARSPLASSSRASRVSSLAHSHSGSVEMNDQSSLQQANMDATTNRTASLSSDEGAQPLPAERASPRNASLKAMAAAAGGGRRLNVVGRPTPNTLSVQPLGLGQSMPNLALSSPNIGAGGSFAQQNTLSVPSSSASKGSVQHLLLSPNHRGVSYPPPSPTRGNLKRGFAITQPSKNPPLLKQLRHVTTTTTINTTNTTNTTTTTAAAMANASNFDFVISEDNTDKR